VYARRSYLSVVRMRDGYAAIFLGVFQKAQKGRDQSRMVSMPPHPRVHEWRKLLVYLRHGRLPWWHCIRRAPIRGLRDFAAVDIVACVAGFARRGQCSAVHTRR
jgi:hypothetical protein